MAQWNAIKLTRRGLQLQAVMQTGAIPLSVTRAAIGNGTPGENIESLTDMVSEITDVNVSIISNDVKDSFAQMVIRIRNGESAFYIKELGIFAEDENGDEILYAYTYADAADYMPAAADGNMTQDITVAVIIGNASEVQTVINTQQGVTIEQLNSSIEDVRTLISSEQRSRETADLDLKNDINAEASARETAYENLRSSIERKADINSPTLTGAPKATTATGSDNSTRIATTAFVKNATASKADIVSPTFTGSPKAPTPLTNSNSDLIATTAFVVAAMIERLAAYTTENEFNGLNNKVNDLFDAMGDNVYFKCLKYADTYTICNDFDEYKLDSAAGTQPIMVVGNAALPKSSTARVFFCTYLISNDDEIDNVQGLLYPDGTIYERSAMLWYYQGGATGEFGDWSTQGTYEWQTRDYFKNNC